MVSCIVPNLEYLAVRILVQNLLDGNVEWRLSLAEGMSVARTTTRVHLALTSHRTRCRVLTCQLHARIYAELHTQPARFMSRAVQHIDPLLMHGILPVYCFFFRKSCFI